ncbi:MAG: heat-inducible transcription repressor HrcA [Chloroflexi bacterium]|nr:heat-inducible transcription repressor HrcA [Chloroflexota bacterium]MCI0846081.1 heat-inducible transcription repressor HrcA [Chloroflexota bacterium]
MLSERAGTVLNILIDQYVNTAAPVASEDIARRSATKVSPATVRSAMSQLAEEGYISRPHVSAGGIPSDMGYRFYVESLKEVPPLPPSVRQTIGDRFHQADIDGDAWSQQCASILSRITANLAIVTVPRASSPRLKHIQLVYLQEALVLLIIVLQETRLLRRLLPLEEGLAQDLLNQTSNTLNERLGGLSYPEIEASKLLFTPLEERFKRDTVVMMREAAYAGAQEHHVEGIRLLLDQPEFSQTSRAKEVVELLDERVLLESVLSEAPQQEDLAIYIGDENPEDVLRPFGVVVGQYGMADSLGGTICVIGPTRMGYAKVMSAVRYLSSFMSQLIAGAHGGTLPSKGRFTP